MKTDGLVSAVVAPGAALLLAGPAQAAPLDTSVPELLAAPKSAKDRRALGLPSCAQILGCRRAAIAPGVDAASFDYTWSYTITIQRI